MINKYTNQEATLFTINGKQTVPSYGYHATVYELGENWKDSRFSIEIKEYKNSVLVQVKFSGNTPNGSAGPHGLILEIQKSNHHWKQQIERVCEKALNRNFSDFPNPTQYNRSIGENNVRTWVADCGTAQDFAEQCFALNT